MSSFHYDFILSKRSSLAKVWLAAHWEKKLSKVQVFETNLQSIVKDILNPKTPIALRTSSHLLVGLVRIYSRKAQYLLKDCSDTLTSIKVAFRPGVSALDMPSKKRKSVKEIMDCPFFITEKVDLLDQWIPETSNVEIDCTLNQSKVEEITLQEEPMKMNSLDDYFDDEGFGEMDIDVTKDLNENCSSVMERVYSFADSAYGTEEPSLGETFSLTDCSDPFSSLTPLKDVNSSSPSKPTPMSGDQLPKLLLDLDKDFRPEQDEAEDTLVLELDPALQDGSEENCHRRPFEEACETLAFEDIQLRLGSEEREFESQTETSEDILVLDPIENTQKNPQSSRKGRKRKLLIDQVISIERAVIFDNLNNPSGLLKQPVCAPRTKRLMKQAEHNASLMLKESSFLELPPSLKVLFHPVKCRKLSSSSDVSDDTVVLNSSSEKNSEQDVDISCQMIRSPDELDISAEFIPLQDVEYSSDEESPMQRVETLNNGLGFTQNAEESEDILVDENISEDKFCSFVETTVLKLQPRAVKFQEIVGGVGKPVTRKIAARRFVKCLIMQRDSRLVLEQDGCFKDIFLHPVMKNAAEKTDV